MNIQVNDKVLCLSDVKNMDERFRVFHPNGFPEKDKIYVVREVRKNPDPKCPLDGLLLVGIDSLNNTDGREQSFSSFDFKLLKDVKDNKFDGEYDFLKDE
jgi:hypothetical protein